MHLAPLVQDLAVILGLATTASLIFQKIGQPVVLGYLLAGIVAGPYTPPVSLVIDMPGVQVCSELGVIFLMFSLGLEFSFRKLRSVGLTAAVAGPLEAIFMLALGFFAGKLVGWSSVDSIFFGAILSISSTTIIIKALEELKLKQQRFAQLIFGILVVEDLVGILILVALSTLAAGQGASWTTLLLSGLKLALVVSVWISAGLLLVPRLVNRVGKRCNDETLTLLSVGLCLGLVVLSAYLHYSVALGAFLMGAILGESEQVHRIERLMAPIRDIFAGVFFVSIGMLLNPAELAKHWQIVLMATVLTIAGKIFSTALGARVTGQSIRTSMKVGMGLAQIGEFSFIIAGLGLSLGVMSPFLYSVAVSVSVITTFTTPYLIRLSQLRARSE